MNARVVNLWLARPLAGLQVQDAIRRKQTIKIEFPAGAHPLAREVTGIEPGAAADGSEALLTADDSRTVPITTILRATIEDDQKISVGH
jgi:hypothetical protein